MEEMGQPHRVRGPENQLHKLIGCALGCLLTEGDSKRGVCSWAAGVSVDGGGSVLLGTPHSWVDVTVELSH